MRGMPVLVKMKRATRKTAARKTGTKNRVRRREREQLMKVAVIKRAEKGALMKFKSKRK